MSARRSCALDEAPQTFNGVHAGPLQRLLPSRTPGQGSDLPQLHTGRAAPTALDVCRDPPGPEHHRGGAGGGCPRLAPPSEPPRGLGLRRLWGGGGSRQAGYLRSVPFRLGPPRRGDSPAGSRSCARARRGRAAPQTTTPAGHRADGRRRGSGAGGRARRAAIGRGVGGWGAHGDGRKERGQMAERWSRGPSRARR